MPLPRLGIDLGGTKCLYLWIDEEAHVVAERRIESPSTASELVDITRQLVSAHPVGSIGIGVPGFVDAERRHIVRCPNLPGYVDVPLVQMLEDATQVPIALENDANAAALAEYRAGAGVGVDDQVFVILGSGVGGAIIANGQLIRGAGFAGEIGHLTIDPDGPPCGCGRRGCWERYASGRALAELADVDRGELVSAALLRGDEWADRALTAYAERVAEGLSDVTLVVAPRLIILGGGVSEIGLPLTTAVERALSTRLPSFVQTPTVVPALLGNSAGAIGAALSD